MFLMKNFKETIFDNLNSFGAIFALVAWAIRSSYNSSTQATPAQLVFGRDMMFNISSLVNWKTLSLKKQNLVDKANLRENTKRVDYNYGIGQQVYVTTDGIQRKLDSPKKGLFRIIDVYTNGTVRIQSGAVDKRINIRRLEPHFT